MNKKSLKKYKYIIIICGIILFIELCFILYSIFFRRVESLYFDGINRLEVNNNYYVTVGSNNDNDNFYEKAKVTKYNNKKEKEFEKLYNVGYNSAFFGVVLDEDNIVAVGSYEKDESDHKNKIRRALIVKYDSTGEVIFENDFKILDNSKFTSITKVEDGYLVTGQTIYKNTKVGSKSGGALLLKYDNSGKLLWYKTYGSSKSAIFNDLLVIGNNIYTVGMDKDYLGILCKYDLAGNFITYNDYKYTDEIGFNGIVSIDNKIFISGANKENSKSINAMIVEYDLNCNYKKQVIYKDEDIARYNKIIKDKNNNLIVIGVKMLDKKKKVKTAGNINYNGIVGKYNSNLKEISVVDYGDDRDDYFTDIKYIDNEYLVVGYSSYEDGSYLSKFIRYSDALKVLGVE